MTSTGKIVFRINGTRRLLAGALALALALLLAGAAPLQAYDAGKVVRKLDAHYYYPQRQGIEKLSVSVDWSQMDVASLDQRYLKNPRVRFVWAPGNVGQFNIVEPEKLSKESRARTLEFFRNYEEIVVPKTLAEQLERYELNVADQSDKSILLNAVSMNAKEKIQSYRFLVDAKNWRIEEIRMRMKGQPREITSSFRYTQKEGKWLLSHSRARFSVQGENYFEDSEYDYKQENGLWLLRRLRQDLKQKSVVVRSYILRAGNYKFN